MKAHAWKACVGLPLPRVRIPPSPPPLAMEADGNYLVSRENDWREDIDILSYQRRFSALKFFWQFCWALRNIAL